MRNVALACVAAFAAFAGSDAGPGLGSLEAGAAAIVAGSFALALLAGVAVTALLWMARRNGLLLLQVDALETALRDHGIPIPVVSPVGPQGLPVGAAAPHFELPGLDGNPVTLDSLLKAGHPTLLVFTSPNCGPCETLMPQVAAWQRDFRDRLTVAVLADGDREDNQTKLEPQGLVNVVVQGASDIAERYAARATPSALVVSPDGRIASSLRAGGESISSLVSDLAVAGGPPELKVVEAG
jgi:methylamine dehydrogenase accessory protein MauD